MHITLETDYAIRIVDCLARAQCRMGAQEIADATGVTLRFSLKILSKLTKSGIFVSFKGTNGGYEMNREPKDISLHDILKTIEGEYRFCRCLDENFHCGRKESLPHARCCYHDFFEELSLEIGKKLSEKTIDEFLQP